MPTITPVTVTRWPTFAQKPAAPVPAFQQPMAANRIQAFDRQSPPERWSASTIRFFNQMWSALHTRALVIAPGTNDLAWLEQFASLIPCGSCRHHWKQMMLTSPPTWRDYFGWTVARHNEVNASLGKPTWQVESARKKWRGGA